MSRNFYWLMGTRFLFVMGVQMQAVLMGWQMYDLSHDPLQLGLVGLAEAIPAISMALFAGWLVDRFNPFRFYQATLVVCFISMYIASIAKEPQYLFIAAALTGIARSFTAICKLSGQNTGQACKFAEQFFLYQKKLHFRLLLLNSY